MKYDEFNPEPNEYNPDPKEYKVLKAIEHFRIPEEKAEPDEIEQYKEIYNDFVVNRSSAPKTRKERLELERQRYEKINNSLNAHSNSGSEMLDAPNVGGGEVLGTSSSSAASTSTASATTSASAAGTSSSVVASSSLVGGVSIIAAATVMAFTQSDVLSESQLRVYNTQVVTGSDFIKFDYDMDNVSENINYTIKITCGGALVEKRTIDKSNLHQSELFQGLDKDKEYKISIYGADSMFKEYPYYSRKCFTVSGNKPRAVYDFNTNITFDELEECNFYSIDYDIFVSNRSKGESNRIIFNVSGIDYTIYAPESDNLVANNNGDNVYIASSEEQIIEIDNYSYIKTSFKDNTFKGTIFNLDDGDEVGFSAYSYYKGQDVLIGSLGDNERLLVEYPADFIAPVKFSSEYVYDNSSLSSEMNFDTLFKELKVKTDFNSNGNVDEALLYEVISDDKVIQSITSVEAEENFEIAPIYDDIKVVVTPIKYITSDDFKAYRKYSKEIEYKLPKMFKEEVYETYDSGYNFSFAFDLPEDYVMMENSYLADVTIEYTNGEIVKFNNYDDVDDEIMFDADNDMEKLSVDGMYGKEEDGISYMDVKSLHIDLYFSYMDDLIPLKTIDYIPQSIVCDSYDIDMDGNIVVPYTVNNIEGYEIDSIIFDGNNNSEIDLENNQIVFKELMSNDIGGTLSVTYKSITNPDKVITYSNNIYYELEIDINSSYYGAYFDSQYNFYLKFDSTIDGKTVNVDYLNYIYIEDDTEGNFIQLSQYGSRLSMENGYYVIATSMTDNNLKVRQLFNDDSLIDIDLKTNIQYETGYTNYSLNEYISVYKNVNKDNTVDYYIDSGFKENEVFTTSDLYQRVSFEYEENGVKKYLYFDELNDSIIKIEGLENREYKIGYDIFFIPDLINKPNDRYLDFNHTEYNAGTLLGENEVILVNDSLVSASETDYSSVILTINRKLLEADNNIVIDLYNDFNDEKIKFTIPYYSYSDIEGGLYDSSRWEGSIYSDIAYAYSQENDDYSIGVNVGDNGLINLNIAIFNQRFTIGDISLNLAPEGFKETYSELNDASSVPISITIGKYMAELDIDSISDNITIGEYNSSDGGFDFGIDFSDSFTSEDPRDGLMVYITDANTNEFIQRFDTYDGLNINKFVSTISDKIKVSIFKVKRYNPEGYSYYEEIVLGTYDINNGIVDSNMTINYNSSSSELSFEAEYDNENIKYVLIHLYDLTGNEIGYKGYNESSLVPISDIISGDKIQIDNLIIDDVVSSDVNRIFIEVKTSTDGYSYNDYRKYNIYPIAKNLTRSFDGTNTIISYELTDEQIERFSNYEIVSAKAYIDMGSGERYEADISDLSGSASISDMHEGAVKLEFVFKDEYGNTITFNID